MTDLLTPSTPTASADRRAELADRFIQALPPLKRRFEARLDPAIRDQLLSVTPHQLQALCALQHAPAGLTMNDLARSQDVGLSSATAMADRLLKHGLAERRTDPNDRRVVRLVTTANAAELIERWQQTRRASALHALGVLDEAELESLVELVEKIATAPTTSEEGRSDA